MPVTPGLTIRDLVLRAVVVPIARAVVTRVITIDRVPLLLLDLHSNEGITGRAYVFSYTPGGSRHMASVLADVADIVRGAPVAPADLHARLEKAFTVMGHGGIAAMALSGFDMACWDALARAAELPLVRLLGGTARAVRAYNSNGLGLVEAAQAAEEARALVAEGDYEAVKIRLGRPTLEEDLAVLRSVREAVGEGTLLPADFNQGLTVMEAVRRGRALDAEGVYWIEEPVRYDDLDGSAKVAREVATPIQIGENLYGPRAVADAIAKRAGDWLMFDAARVGGVTGWLRAAALAEAAGVEVSSHLFPEFSRHLMAVTPTRHWLEFVDWAAPILTDPPRVVNGSLAIPEAPGAGIEWDEDAVARYSVG